MGEKGCEGHRMKTIAPKTGMARQDVMPIFSDTLSPRGLSQRLGKLTQELDFCHPSKRRVQK